MHYSGQRVVIIGISFFLDGENCLNCLNFTLILRDFPPQSEMGENPGGESLELEFGYQSFSAIIAIKQTY